MRQEQKIALFAIGLNVGFLIDALALFNKWAVIGAMIGLIVAYFWYRQ